MPHIVRRCCCADRVLYHGHRLTTRNGAVCQKCGNYLVPTRTAAVHSCILYMSTGFVLLNWSDKQLEHIAWKPNHHRCSECYAVDNLSCILFSEELNMNWFRQTCIYNCISTSLITEALKIVKLCSVIQNCMPVIMHRQARELLCIVCSL